MLDTNSPGLIAGFHVLHRLLTPRHPPYALISLITSTFCRCNIPAGVLPTRRLKPIYLGRISDEPAIAQYTRSVHTIHTKCVAHSKLIHLSKTGLTWLFDFQKAFVSRSTRAIKSLGGFIAHIGAGKYILPNRPVKASWRFVSTFFSRLIWTDIKKVAGSAATWVGRLSGTAIRVLACLLCSACTL